MLIGFLILIAAICEFVDSSIGMMYGTLLTPALLLFFGYTPAEVVPCILLSQAAGGFIASYQHHRMENAIFNLKSTDFKVASLILLLGFVAVIFGVFLGVKIPALYLKTYIGILCICMGFLVLLKKSFSFSWIKMGIISLISSFNKALSGGGFGPIVVSGQIVSGRENKESIGTTDFAEAPICLFSYIVWRLLGNNISGSLLYPLLLGSCLGGFFGPLALSKIQSQTRLRKVIGLIVGILGVLLLKKAWL